MLVIFSHSIHPKIKFYKTYNCNSYELQNEIEKEFHNACLIYLRGEHITSINMLKMGNKFVYNVRTDRKTVEMTYTVH